MQTMTIHPLILQKIAEVASRYPTVQHPLIAGIIHQQFDLEQMHLIAERFYHVIRNFPRFIARMIAHWDNTVDRMPLVENLFEEHGRMDTSKIHVNTYVDFLAEMGLDVERITKSEISPATFAYIHSVLDICSQGNQNLGLGALAYIEDIVHQVSAVITAAVHQKRHDHVSHFSDHEVLDDQHSKEIYHMLRLEQEHDRNASLTGITMGAYFHFQLYESILAEVLYETGATKEGFAVAEEHNAKAAYPLKTGEEGLKRLDILNGLYNENSLACIIEQAGEGSKKILEYGCGTGRLSFELSQRSPNWRILAVDNSAQQIECARKLWPHHQQLQFETADYDDVHKLGSNFDLIYLRWVLIYQKDVKPFLHTFANLLRAGGVLIIEDNEPGQSGCFSATHQKHLDRWQNFWTQAVSVIGQKPGFVKRLVDDAQDAGLLVKHLGINQQVLRTKAEKEVFVLGIRESEEAILGAGVPQSLCDEIVNNAASLIESELPIGFVRNFQLCLVKR